MSWHYLQGQEEDSWEGHCLDGAPSVLLSLIPTAAGSCSLDSEMDTFPGFPSGTISAPSTAGAGGIQLTLFQEGSPARTSAVQVRERDLPDPVRAFGFRCSVLLARFGLLLSGRKTVRISVPVDSAPSSMDLPAWGMTADGACWELFTLARRTKENASGFLPTPTTRNNELSPSMQKWPGHRRLLDLLGCLPTPLACDAKGSHGRGRGDGGPKLCLPRAFKEPLLPTPTANTYGSNQGGGAGRTGNKHPSLETLTGGAWIAFREWLMGWPIGWTALEPLGTDRFRRWLRLHGAC